MDPTLPPDLATALGELTIEEKASLTAGHDVWHLPALPTIGLQRVRMSDGPSGVRGTRVGTRRSLSFPCGLAAGATWDTELTARYGTALAEEARAKGVHLLLGPTVGIVRIPVGGRTFESFAEDPHLAARLTVAYIQAVQAGGVGCCVKHFACNDQEHERMSISAEVDERTLREVHLRPFEAAVTEAGTWSIMSAYNRLNGTYCGEHPELLRTILKEEWGFDGVVVSDWFGAHSTVEASTAGLDVAMPAPSRFLGQHLADAVHAGEVPEAVLDEAAGRVLRLAQRTGALGGPAHDHEDEKDAPHRRALARELACAATVLLRNDGILPLDAQRPPAVALIGPNAARLAARGGGSSTVTPFTNRNLVDELRDRLGSARVAHEEGCRLEEGLVPMDDQLLPDGLELSYFSSLDLTGEPAGTETTWTSQFLALGDPHPGVDLNGFSIRSRATFAPDQSGTWQIGIANTGTARLLFDGQLLVDNTTPARGSSFFGLGSTTVAAEVALKASTEHEIVVEAFGDGRVPVAGFTLFAARPPLVDGIDRAVAAAREADVAVVVVGTNSHIETEGADRNDLRLAGDQDELVERVLAANPRTIVVVNTGAPVEMPWAEDAAAVLVVWFPGEEGAAALVDVLTGAAEPGGRLPVTFPARFADSAAYRWYPGQDGKVTYGEGTLVGYRHFETHGVEPRYAFGHGLSYTTFEVGEPAVEGEGTVRTVKVPVTNTGSRPGSTVVQVYVAAAEPAVPRAPKELKGFAKVTLEPGASATAAVTLDERSFARWNAEAHGWTVDPGGYHLLVGTSSRAIHHRLTVELG